MRWRRPSGVLLALVLAGLLGLLATLQWHWLGRISASEQARMQHTLQRQSEGLAEDFDREITRAYFWLQMDRIWLRVDRLAGRIGDDEPPLRPFDRWFTSSPHPELVEAIYQVSRRDDGALALARYERGTATFTPLARWPARLAALEARLEADLATDSAADSQGDGLPGRPRTGYIERSIPALVIPRPAIEFRTRILGDADDAATDAGDLVARAVRDVQGSDVTLAILDTAYIRDELLPSLTARHFRVNGRLEYRVAVRDRGSRELVYCSAVQAADCAFDDPDHAEDLLDIRARDFGRFLVDDRLHPAPAAGEASAYRLMRVRPPDAPDEAGPDRRPRRDGHWMVAVKHQAGSLEAVVASARSRNLFVSFGILLLLATSIGLVLLSTGRARQLAAQQMEFVAGVSHELRTPLAVIRSAAENLADGVVSDGGQVRRYGALIASEGRRLTHMVEQVMEFAGVATGGRQLDLRPVSLRTVVEEALAVCLPQAREQGCSIDLDLPADLPAVMADRAALSRSVENLLGNAIKYGGRGGGVRLTAAVGPPRSEVQLSVADRGPGIAAEDLPRIFEPFYRGRAADDQRVYGSGLGLSLVARIMEQHRGKVTVRSRPGSGATFTLHIPAAPPADEPAAEAATA